MRLSIEVLGEDIVARRLLRFAHSVQDARPEFRRIATMLSHAADRQFATEGSYGGRPWPPLAESTLRSKPAGLPILVRTGRLRGSLTGHGEGHVERVLPQMLEWGSSVPYGRYHMTGTSRMPARPPVQLPEQLKRRIVKELQSALVRELRGI